VQTSRQLRQHASSYAHNLRPCRASLEVTHTDASPMPDTVDDRSGNVAKDVTRKLHELAFIRTP